MYTHPDILDAPLDAIANAADLIVICSAEPASYAQALALSLGSAVPSFTGPLSDGGSGRKLTVDAVSGADVTADGDPTHVALLDTITERLLHVTEESTLQAVVSGNLWNLAAWDIEFPGPA